MSSAFFNIFPGCRNLIVILTRFLLNDTAMGLSDIEKKDVIHKNLSTKPFFLAKQQ